MKLTKRQWAETVKLVMAVEEHGALDLYFEHWTQDGVWTRVRRVHPNGLIEYKVDAPDGFRLAADIFRQACHNRYLDLDCEGALVVAVMRMTSYIASHYKYSDGAQRRRTFKIVRVNDGKVL